MKIRYYVGTEHASGKDVSSDKAVLSDPRVRVPGGGHEMGGSGMSPQTTTWEQSCVLRN